MNGPGMFGHPSGPPARHPSPGSKESLSERGDDDDTSGGNGVEETLDLQRFPLSELVPRDIEGFRSRTPSSRSTSIRSTNSPHGNLLPTNLIGEPSEPVPASVYPFTLHDPLALATITEHDAQVNHHLGGLDHIGSIFPPPSLSPLVPQSSDFSVGQPRELSSPIAEIPKGAVGISRPPGAPPTQRQGGSGPIQIRPDNPFSTPQANDEEARFEEGHHWEKENIDPNETFARLGNDMDTSDEEGTQAEEVESND